MPRFILIDHSVKRVGGHNYEYAFHILRAAEQAGYQPVLVVNRRFFEKHRLPPTWQLLTAYHHTTYEFPKFEGKQKQLDPDGSLRSQIADSTTACPLRTPTTNEFLRQPWRSLKAWRIARLERLKRTILSRFANDTAEVFSQLQITADDQIFVPTLSESDLVGWCDFVRSEPRAAVCNWHLQFHFKLFNGREPAYAEQYKKLAPMKRIFTEAANCLPEGKLHFYTTTELLADQYNRLDAAPFTTLPYPVNPELLNFQSHEIAPGTALRVTCAGGIRPEKGSHNLDRATGPLWKEYFAAGKLRLIVQSKRLGKLPRILRKQASYDQVDRNPNAISTVGVVRWPLATDQYLKLIQTSDIGLLLYDSDTYYVRCSGVMVEMLKAGVPVIVPAGCWMADQIYETIFQHRDSLLAQLASESRLSRVTTMTAAGAAPTCSNLPWTLELERPLQATHLAWKLEWTSEFAHGVYLDSICEQLDATGKVIQTVREIIGPRPDCQPASLIVRLVAGAKSVRLQLRNAFDQTVIQLHKVACSSFQATTDMPLPTGAVGLVAADIDQVPELLRDMANHYSHYRSTALQFAPAWGNWHSPETVVQELISAGVPANESGIMFRVDGAQPIAKVEAKGSVANNREVA
ncbi:MAG: hypothetical protein SGJ20_13735 [Planctomycetota bacterium]|nr:hypothetical protein [Planctomycetota bacterium]